MPTYDYRCNSCGHRWELFQSMTAKPEKACPHCDKKTAERLIGTGAALLFKGSGFYQTDYRSEGYKKAAKADAKPDSSASTTSTSSTDSSPKSPAATPPATPSTQAAPATKHAKSKAPKAGS